MLPQFDNPDLAKQLLDRIHAVAAGLGHMRIMEVCGTHTMEIGRLGLRSVLPENIKLVSGPGCPVCVTPGAYIDAAVTCVKKDTIRILTYGDMVRVPGNTSSLEEARAAGADIRVVTSALQAVEEARHTDKEVVFLAVGFETTTPPTAAAVIAAREHDIANLSFLASHRIVPPALAILADDPELGLAGFLLPGHVSAVIGLDAYGVLEERKLPGVVTGFAALDILAGIYEMCSMLASDTPAVRNAYPRVVKPEGNPAARALVERVFQTADTDWRGIGVLPGCGLVLKDEFAPWDAEKKFNLDLSASAMPPGCSCGDVLRGKITPDACPLFDNGCDPGHPVGPCMVSSEGSCAAYYKYER